MKRLATFGTVIVAVGWGLYAFAGHRLAAALAKPLSGTLLKLGEGKVTSPGDFIHRRMFEVAWLATLILAWFLAHWVVQAFVRGAGRKRYAWIAHCVVGFIALNLWLSQATQMAAFWILNWDGGQSQNLTRFHIKRILAREGSTGPRAVLVGSSQTRAQIDEAILNAALGPRLRTTDLNYPGAKALDVLILDPMFSESQPDYVIWYVSEAYFYGGSSSEVIPNFLRIEDLPDLFRRGCFRFVPRDRMAYGILGDLLPVFRLREVFAQRVLGPELGHLQQQQYDTLLETELVMRAQRAAVYYRLNKESHFQQLAMEEFVIRCQRSRKNVILLTGQLHPVFEGALDPAMRPEMFSFLRRLAEQYPNVTLIEKLPEQLPADYVDLTHVNRAAQERFSRFLATELDVILKDTASRNRK